MGALGVITDDSQADGCEPAEMRGEHGLSNSVDPDRVKVDQKHHVQISSAE
jgi:hypothetical protein